MFTDGSKLEAGEAGFGVFFETPVSGEHAVGQKLGPHPTVFQAGAMVITKACEAVSAVMAEEGVPNAVTIYSDSQSVLQALNSCWITSKTVWECAYALMDLGKFVSGHLRWVKGHSRIPDHLPTIGKRTRTSCSRNGRQTTPNLRGK